MVKLLDMDDIELLRKRLGMIEALVIDVDVIDGVRLQLLRSAIGDTGAYCADYLREPGVVDMTKIARHLQN